MIIPGDTKAVSLQGFTDIEMRYNLTLSFVAYVFLSVYKTHVQLG